MKLNKKIIKSLINEVLKRDELQDPNKQKEESNNKEVPAETSERN
jgi:hypothetical protein